MTIAELSLEHSGLFEAELLVELMLRYWNHPYADQQDFRENLLEGAAEILRSAIRGEVVIDGLPPDRTNLLAALWYAEFVSVEEFAAESRDECSGRKAWLQRLQMAVPSCFCNPDELT